MIIQYVYYIKLLQYRPARKSEQIAKGKKSQTTKTKRHEYHNSQPATLDTLSCWLNSVIVFSPCSPCCHRKDAR